MKFENTGTVTMAEDLSSAEAEIGLSFPTGLREHFLRANGGVPEPYIFRRENVTVAMSECLPLRADGRGVSALNVYRMLALDKGVIPKYLFPFAVDGGGNLFVIDCRSGDGWVYIWWHDVPDDSLLDLHTRISDFWSHLAMS